MQIHELNEYGGNLGQSSYLAVDDGNDTGKLSTDDLLSNVKEDITNLDNRIDNLIEGVTVDSEVIDARIGANGITYPTLGTAIRTQVDNIYSDLDDFRNDIATEVVSKNRYDKSYIADKFVSPVDGKLYDSTAYGASYYIDVSKYDSVVFSSHDQNIAMRYALYSVEDESSFISGALPTATLDSDLVRFYYVIDTSAANYMRFSVTKSTLQNQDNSKYMIEEGSTPTAFVEYFKDYYYLDTQDVRQLESAVLGKSLDRVYGTMSNGTKFEVESNSIRKSNQIVFFGKFSAFNTLYVGHGETGSNTEFISIDNTNIYFATNGVVPGTGYPHGLTLTDYIGVIIDIAEDCVATIRLFTNGGTFTRTLPSTSPWLGCSGAIFAKSINSVFGYAILTWNADYQKNKWLFGDSYMTNFSSDRWTYYLQQMGFNNSLINAFPGEGSLRALTDWQTARNHGEPKYALWALGMNDSDSGSINASWKTAIDAFIADCEQNGIVPILATIPNTPTQTHTYKNTYVKSLGYRYIDFAEAVNASAAGATWYDGCLSNDNIHPTADGARLLFMQALTDFPELMQK